MSFTSIHRPIITTAAALLPPMPDPGRVHEVLADPLQSGAATGFCLGLLRVISGRDGHVAWLRQAAAAAEAGAVFAPGLTAFGLEPARLTLMVLPKLTDLLRAGIDCARCTALSAVALEIDGAASAIDLATSRRLVLAAEASGVAIFLLRSGGKALPSAAWMRWRVAAARSVPTMASEGIAAADGAAFAIGPARFDITLVRHRGGHPLRRWLVEWNSEQYSFATPLSGAVVSLSDGRALAA